MAGLGNFSNGFFQGAQNTLGLMNQYSQMQRQKTLDAQADERFKAWQGEQDYNAETRRQQAALADDMQRGGVDNTQTAATLNASASTPDAQQWTPQQVAGLSRGPGGAFDASAGPALPAVRTPLKGSEVQTRIGGLALRRGDLNGATAAQQSARMAAIDEGVQSYMQDFDKNPDAFTQHLTRMANLSTSSLSVAKDPKTGYYMTHVIDSNGDASVRKLSGSQLRQLALAEAYIQAGAHDKGIAAAATVDKDIADAIARDSATALQSAQANNVATHYGRQDANAAVQLGIQRSRLSIEEGNQRLAKMGAVRQYRDPQTGQVKEFYPVATAGGVSWQPVPTPQGLVPYVAPRQYTEGDVQKLTAQIMGAIDSRFENDQAGARAEAIRQLGGTGDPRPAVTIDSDALLKELQKSKTDGNPKPAFGLALPSVREALAKPATLAEIYQGDANRRLQRVLRSGVAQGVGLQTSDYDNLQFLAH